MRLIAIPLPALKCTRCRSGDRFIRSFNITSLFQLATNFRFIIGSLQANEFIRNLIERSCLWFKQNVSGMLAVRRQIQTEYRGRLTLIVSVLTLSLSRVSYMIHWCNVSDAYYYM